MEKALKIGKVLATGSFRLFVGVATSNVIMRARIAEKVAGISSARKE